MRGTEASLPVDRLKAAISVMHYSSLLTLVSKSISMTTASGQVLYIQSFGCSQHRQAKVCIIRKESLLLTTYQLYGSSNSQWLMLLISAVHFFDLHLHSAGIISFSEQEVKKCYTMGEE